MDEFFLTNLPRDIVDLKEEIFEKYNHKEIPKMSKDFSIYSQQIIANNYLDKANGLITPKRKKLYKNQILPNNNKSKFYDRGIRSASANELFNTNNISDSSNKKKRESQKSLGEVFNAIEQQRGSLRSAVRPAHPPSRLRRRQ